jgi:hypothetical protein
MAVRHEFSRRGRTSDVPGLLTTLQENRDLAHLPRGFWLPAPLHFARGTTLCVLVCGKPTEHLHGSMRLVPDAIGTSRLIDLQRTPETDVPTISLSSWCGMPASTSAWLIELLQKANFAPPYRLDGADVFRHWKSPSRGRWLPLSDRVPEDECYALGRHAGRLQSTYFLLRMGPDGVNATADLPQDSDSLVRIMCALRSRGDAPRVVLDHEHGSFVKVRAEIAPRAERRLLAAVGALSTGESAFNVEATIHRAASDDVAAMFRAAGCTVERRSL